MIFWCNLVQRVQRLTTGSLAAATADRIRVQRRIVFHRERLVEISSVNCSECLKLKSMERSEVEGVDA
ncbi:hypothetical protein ACFX1T_035039 [Malus domestica]